MIILYNVLLFPLSALFEKSIHCGGCFFLLLKRSINNEKPNGHFYFISKMDKKIFGITCCRMGVFFTSNTLDCLGSKKEKTVILTKRYFKKFQYNLLFACILAASIIGSIQTGLIIFKCKGKKNHG
jgi:hypothetical protein